MKISQSPRYKKDLEKFNNALKKVADVKKKNYFQKLIDEFQFQIKLIDDAHSSNNPGVIKPRALQENLKDLISLRHQLENLTKDTK